MFDNLSERLERSFKILKGEGKITEINVAETLKDVRKAESRNFGNGGRLCGGKTQSVYNGLQNPQGTCRL